jgi:hypothetical protein
MRGTVAAAERRDVSRSDVRLRPHRMNNATEAVTSADGTSIAFERTGDGRPVILIGGAFNDRSTVAALAAALAPDLSAIAYDRRGRGDSGDNDSYADAIPPGGRYVTLDDQDHAVLHQPEALRPALLDFLT